jgi:hypothetical protein
VIEILAALALAVTPAQYLHARQAENGGFAEPGGAVTVGLTAWAALGLAAAGEPDSAAAAYLHSHEQELSSPTDLALALAAEAAAGAPSEALLARVLALRKGSGAIGPTLNSTVWGTIALRQAGVAPGPATGRYIAARQYRSGGWSWQAGSAPDSNDTAAAIQALRSLGVSGRPVRRGLAYLRRLQNRDGGFELTQGRGSDAQSTAWAIQAFLAAGARPGQAAYHYLARLRRPDGSYRYSARYAVTPVWVTAQVLPALAGRSFPLG